MDFLVEIPRESLSKLKDLFLINWPQYINANYTVDNYIRWLNLSPDMSNVTFWSLNGEWSQNGTFILIVRKFC
jgi:hypothetical protein